MRATFLVVFSVAYAAGLCGTAVAGNIDSPGLPSAGSGLYTLDNLYDYVTSGAELAVQSGFQGPPSGPTSGTMRSTKDIGDALEGMLSQCTVTPDKVVQGTTFFSAQPENWGVRTGTLDDSWSGTRTYVKVYPSQNQVIPTTTDTVINMNMELFDVLGEWNTGTYMFTAQKTGVYLCTLSLMWDSGTAVAGDTIGGMFKVNGTKHPDVFQMCPTTGGNFGFTISETYKLDAGGTIQFLARHVTGSNRTLRSSENYCVGSITRIQ